MREAIDRTNSQVAQLRSRRDCLADALQQNEAPFDGLKQELEAQLELRLQAEGELSAARQQVAELDYLLRQQEQQRAAIEQRAESVRSELERNRISHQALQVRRETIPAAGPTGTMSTRCWMPCRGKADEAEGAR
jgi:chromosome segregation protein